MKSTGLAPWATETACPRQLLPQTLVDIALKRARAGLRRSLPPDGDSSPPGANRITRGAGASTEFGLEKPDGPENYARKFLIPVLNHLRATRLQTI